jgi:hypothetical protein
MTASDDGRSRPTPPATGRLWSAQSAPVSHPACARSPPTDPPAASTATFLIVGESSASTCSWGSGTRPQSRFGDPFQRFGLPLTGAAVGSRARRPQRPPARAERACWQCDRPWEQAQDPPKRSCLWCYSLTLVLSCCGRGTALAEPIRAMGVGGAEDGPSRVAIFAKGTRTTLLSSPVRLGCFARHSSTPGGCRMLEGPRSSRSPWWCLPWPRWRRQRGQRGRPGRQQADQAADRPALARRPPAQFMTPHELAAVTMVANDSKARSPPDATRRKASWPGPGRPPVPRPSARRGCATCGSTTPPATASSSIRPPRARPPSRSTAAAWPSAPTTPRRPCCF